MERNYTNAEITAYNKEREKYLQLQAQKEAEYKVNINELDKAIENLNNILKEDGIDITITKDNFEEVYEKLNKKKNEDMEKGIAIMNKLKQEMSAEEK